MSGSRVLRAGRHPGVEYLVCLGVLLFIVANVSGTSGSSWEIDEVGTVTRVVDGDTFDATPVGRIRLADVDSPEVGGLGAREATVFLSSLVRNRVVYLDVDDLFLTDVYGRVVAVVYVRHNSTHLLNVNQALLESGLATMTDFPNEFDPETWILHTRHPTPAGMSETPAASLIAVTPVIVIAVAFVSLILLHRRNT